MDTQNTNQSKGSNVFSFLYRTRIKISKGEICIVNLSLIFCILAVLSAPWLAVIGLLVALSMGYKLGIERNAPEFSGDFHEVVKDATENVKAAVNNVVNNQNDDDNE